MNNVLLYKNGGESMALFTGKDPVTKKSHKQALKDQTVVAHRNWINDEWEMEVDEDKTLPVPYPRTGEVWMCNVATFDKLFVAMPVKMWQPARSYPS